MKPDRDFVNSENASAEVDALNVNIHHRILAFLDNWPTSRAQKKLCCQQTPFRPLRTVSKWLYHERGKRQYHCWKINSTYIPELHISDMHKNFKPRSRFLVSRLDFSASYLKMQFTAIVISWHEQRTLASAMSTIKRKNDDSKQWFARVLPVPVT